MRHANPNQAALFEMPHQFTPEQIRTAHSATAGRSCSDAGDGSCIACGVILTPCLYCDGIGYHATSCAQWQAEEEHSRC